jgi:hypothetical protein
VDKAGLAIRGRGVGQGASQQGLLGWSGGDTAAPPLLLLPPPLPLPLVLVLVGAAAAVVVQGAGAGAAAGCCHARA